MEEQLEKQTKDSIGKTYLKLVSQVVITISTIALVMNLLSYIGNWDSSRKAPLYLIGCASSLFTLMFGLIGLAVDDIRNKLK